MSGPSRTPPATPRDRVDDMAQDSAERPLLVRVLLNPAAAVDLSPAAWDLLLRQARRANLAGRLARQMADGGWLDQLPAPVQPHLRAALLLSRRQAQMLGREVDLLRETLADLPGPLILLKGAAYALGGHSPAPGRMFSDIDLLLPPDQLARAETTLLVQGWAFDDLDRYDQRYYRQWMHELPPLHHKRRGTSLDLHHTLLPPTARTPLNSRALFDAPRELPGRPGVFVLPPEDMLLHSAAHLFHEGELPNGLRDLFDLDALLREFGAIDGFWTRLLARSAHIGLNRPLALALRYTRRWLDTPFPDALLEQLPTPSTWRQRVLDACYRRALRPAHESCRLPGHDLAALALYVRSHWLRMPLPLLARHLVRKGWARLTESPQTPDAPAAPTAPPTQPPVLTADADHQPH
ncbi:nucleotidyltransferase domain-containing protein [Roseateles amylovorans]|uniref:Nucleotidyltransferase family protein n=1 Tax=Roseateles amylovorans TaxID=2978473 RepID=A0ABY6B1N4_9BURK|nr:nucleotidyltransferase family protein [Roseateles amylovorans]UXH78750.1 nucleotidyltransferase family protein [Roseateles amylovorans]